LGISNIVFIFICLIINELNEKNIEKYLVDSKVVCTFVKRKKRVEASAETRLSFLRMCKDKNFILLTKNLEL
jgi:hypothetical protein